MKRTCLSLATGLGVLMGMNAMTPEAKAQDEVILYQARKKSLSSARRVVEKKRPSPATRAIHGARVTQWEGPARRRHEMNSSMFSAFVTLEYPFAFGLGHTLAQEVPELGIQPIQLYP